MKGSSTTRSSRASGLIGPGAELLRAESDEDLLRRLFALIVDLGGAPAVDGLLQRRGIAGLSDGCVGPELQRAQSAVRIVEEVARRVAVGRSTRCQLRSPEDVASVAKCELVEADRERLLLLICDAGNRILHTAIVTEGTADRLLIPVRETLALVLKHGGRGFAVAHNHPSGDTTPSPADAAGTGSLARAAKVVGLRFLGHVIVAGESWQAVDSVEGGERGVDG